MGKRGGERWDLATSVKTTAFSKDFKTNSPFPPMRKMKIETVTSSGSLWELCQVMCQYIKCSVNVSHHCYFQLEIQNGMEVGNIRDTLRNPGVHSFSLWHPPPLFTTAPLHIRFNPRSSCKLASPCVHNISTSHQQHLLSFPTPRFRTAPSLKLNFQFPVQISREADCPA